MIEKIKGLKEFAHGKRGIVYVGELNNRTVAVKKKRQDSNAMFSIENEARFLRILNKHNIGPEFIESGNDYVMYYFVEGEFVVDFFEKAKLNEILRVIKDVFSQMYKLDCLGINKYEMHHPVKHVIVTPELNTVLIDFERCRYTEDPKNVTQFVQFLTSDTLSVLLKKKGLVLDSEKLRELCHRYKNNYSVEIYREIIKF